VPGSGIAAKAAKFEIRLAEGIAPSDVNESAEQASTHNRNYPRSSWRVETWHLDVALRDDTVVRGSERPDQGTS
jgi:hypothetical protein